MRRLTGTASLAICRHLAVFSGEVTHIKAMVKRMGSATRSACCLTSTTVRLGSTAIVSTKAWPTHSSRLERTRLS